MDSISKDALTQLALQQGIKKRLIRELRYAPDTMANWEERDFLLATTKSGNEGILFYEGAVISFERSARRANAKGRVEAIICDICATWQRGSNSSIVSFHKPTGTVSYLICGDFECSFHVRDMTDASKLSRAQLREQMSIEQRVVRLKTRLSAIIENVQS